MTVQEAIEKMREFCKLRAFCELYPDACQKDNCEIYMAIEALQHDCEKVAESSDDYITIKRQFVLDAINIGLSGYISDDDKLTLEGMGIAVSELPSAQPETFEWCHDCKEYDKEQHCCHRWSQQIRKTIEELEASYPQEAKDELLYWKERAAKWERDYYITVTGIRKHVPNIDMEEVEEDE